MAENLTLIVQPREGRGSRAAQKLRRAGQIPAVLYGHKEANVTLSLSTEAVSQAIRHHTRLVDLNLNGKTEKALIRDIQYDHLGKEILHVDFFRVSAEERIEVTVPIELRGVAPGASSGVLDQPLHVLKIECPAIAIPDSIKVNIETLQLGQVIHVRELQLPPNVKALADADAVVVQIKQKALEPEAAAAAGANEPEVITAKKKEKEAEA